MQGKVFTTGLLVLLIAALVSAQPWPKAKGSHDDAADELPPAPPVTGDEEAAPAPEEGEEERLPHQPVSDMFSLKRCSHSVLIHRYLTYRTIGNFHVLT